MNSGAGHPAPERIVAEETLGEVLSQLLTAEARSAIAAAGKQVVTFADQLRPVLATLLKRLVPLARNMDAVFQAPRAASYEPLLIEMGYAPVGAQILSLWILTNGRRWAKDLDVSRRKLGSALRQLVKAADLSPLVRARRAAVLLPLLDDWTRPWVETAIADSGVPLSFEEFRDLVREAAEGQPSACGRLCEIAPQIFRHVPKARGASLKAPTVTHALLLMIAHDAGHPAAYTYCPYEEDWVDRMTEATRRQLQQPRFSPIAARRLLKSQKWTDS